MPASAMFDIVNVSKLKLKVTVNETQVASLKTGSPVTVSASVFQIKYLLVKSFSSPQKQTKA
jgi:multidrug resistance efflux pump